MQAHFNQITSPGVRMLSDDQCRKVYEAVLRVLEEKGSIIDNDEAKGLLIENGASETPDGKILIPRSLVEQAISTVPKSFTLYNRDGNVYMPNVGGYNSYCGTCGDCPDILDLKTGVRRPFVKSDWADMATILDYCKNLKFYHLGGSCGDLDPYEAYRECGYRTMPYTRAVPVLCMGNKDAAAELVEVAQAIAGGAEEFKRKPNMFAMAEPISPLKHDDDAVSRIMIYAKNSVPLVYYGMQMQGASAPASAAGTIVIGAAESLTGMVIHQLTNPGAPFVFGCIPAIMDMKTMSYTYGGPELTRNLMGITDLAHYLKIPCWGTTTTDAKQVDAQCGAEFTISLITDLMGGSNLIHDCGMMDSAMVMSMESIVFHDELIEMCKVIMEGIPCDDDSLAVDVIGEVGASGDFLGHKHTRERFKGFWTSYLFDRSMDYKTADPFETRARNRAQDILDTHVVPSLSEEKLQAIAEVKKKWEAKRSSL